MTYTMKAYVNFALQTAKQAGEILLKNQGKMHDLEWKERSHFRT